MCSSKGIISKDSYFGNHEYKKLAEYTNPENIQGSLADAVEGADIFLGVSVAGILTKEMEKKMNRDSIIFAMANPVLEIMPELAFEGVTKIVGTGRCDYPNQINNVLAFPGIFRGALDVRAKDINYEMKNAAAYALAGLVSQEEMAKEIVIPCVFGKKVGSAVAKSVRKAAIASGVARKIDTYYKVL